MASYLYYIHDKSLLDDHVYDKLSKKVLSGWDDFEHRHKRLISKSDLDAGTLFSLRNDHYPLIVRSASQRLYGVLHEKG